MQKFLIGLALCPTIIFLPIEKLELANATLTGDDIRDILDVTALALKMPDDMAEGRNLEISLVEIRGSSEKIIEEKLSHIMNGNWEENSDDFFQVSLTAPTGGMKNGEIVKLISWLPHVNEQAGWKMEIALLTKSRLGDVREMLRLPKGEWRNWTTRRSKRGWIASGGAYYFPGVHVFRLAKDYPYSSSGIRALVMRVAIK